MSVVVSSAFAHSSKEDGNVVVGTDAIWENWFVSGGIGTSMYAGEADRFGTIGSRLALDFDLSLGKWFTPYMGARVQYSGATLKGNTYSGSNIFATGSANSEGLYNQKWNYMYLHFDAMLNISNFFNGGYNEDRFYSFIPYAGAGWARTHKNNSDALAVNFGIYNTVKVNSRVDLFLDIRGVVLGDDAIDAEVGGDYGIDGILTATVGVNIKLGKHGWKRPVPQCEIDAYKSAISAKDAEIADYKAQLEKLKSEEEKPRRRSGNRRRPEASAEPTSNVERSGARVESTTSVEIPETVISFEISSCELSKLAKVNLSNIAKVIRKYQSSDKYLVIGYADRATGSADLNNKLSETRAKSVYNYLVDDCRVEPSKLVVESKGGVDNMFYDDAALSRVVVVKVAE